MEKTAPKTSIVLPCRNEETALPFCLEQIKKTIQKNNLSAEIIVSDSSTDKSPEIAGSDPAIILVKHGRNGYGAAYSEGFKAVRGKYIFMADADCSYDFREIPRFIKFLDLGYDLVIGDRFSGKIEKGAMPLARRLGNPLLSGILRLFFKTQIKDCHCGMRAIKKDCLKKLDLKTKGMEFASEMVIKVIKNNLKIKELPINYLKRKGKSKLSLIADPLRHIWLMLKLK